MAKSLKQINEQIAMLRSQAQTIEAKERQGVIGRIKTAIEHYGLTASELGYAGKALAGKSTTGSSKPASTSKALKKPGAIKFRDGNGNAWTGHGKRPRWFLAALAAGRQPEEMLVKD